MNAVVSAVAVAIVAGSFALPTPALAAGGSEPPAIFQCSSKDGRVVFSDEPCVGAPSVKLWSPKSPAGGIARSGPPAAAPAGPMARLAPDASVRYDPYVDCRRRGGRYETGSRICRLPDDAAKQMFDSN